MFFVKEIIPDSWWFQVTDVTTILANMYLTVLISLEDSTNQNLSEEWKGVTQFCKYERD